MNFNKFTIKSQEALQNAQEIASSYGNQVIEPEHLLAALVQDAGRHRAARSCRKCGANVNYVKIKLNELIERLPEGQRCRTRQQGMSQASDGYWRRAAKQAQELKDEYVSTEHLLLALVGRAGQRCRAQLLRDQGVTQGSHAQGAQGHPRKPAGHGSESRGQIPGPAAVRPGSERTRATRENGSGDRRDEEIRRVLQVLSRRTKNNPVLIGEPGVGKTAIAEGIAHRIVKGDVPETLKTKRIVALDMGPWWRGPASAGSSRSG